MRIEGSNKSSAKDINKAHSKVNEAKKTKKTDHRRVSSVTKSFKNLIVENDSQYSEEVLKALLEDAVNSGNEFVKMPTMANLKLYKSKIEKYMEYVVNKLYVYNTEISEDKKKLYRIMDKVNDYVHNLTKMLLENEKSTIAYVAKVEEIRGLLLDMYR
jgi:uncharacterized protein YaaR (DUF327 family)